MFVLISIVGRDLGRTVEYPTYDEALEAAVKLCLQQCDESEESIRKELLSDNDYWYGATADEGWAVYIAQTEKA
tara:strand:- start:191 stop:412 length:222 start_codon:yes stop_codon:yes gene_type:complete